jgi:hypothetical protein
MIPYDIDPSLHDREPPVETLEDGFSPPHPHEEVHPHVPHAADGAALEAALAGRSPF